MFKITILDEQEPSVQSADRTKAVQAWSWGNMYSTTTGPIAAENNGGFHARQ